MKHLKQAFSLVELIIGISTIIIISVIAVTSMEGAKDKSNNSKILSDLDTLSNAFKSYSEEVKDLPQPKGNLQYYGEDTGYRHNYENAFGVSGYVTNDVLPAKYMNNLPLDPKTGQYYGYARTKNTLHFEVAGVLFEDNTPKAKVSGNWTGEFGPYNLVKEFAGPNFVYDNGRDFFPYNPYEKMLLAKVSSYTGGILKINDKVLPDSEVLEYNLGEGDTLEISTGGTINLYFSDGSNSVLGDTESDSKVTLENMKFVDDNNIYTSIKLALNMGSLWTKASKMSDKSEFEVYTTDALAAVRGTIFGLRQGNSNSDIVVQEGKVEAQKIIAGTGHILSDTSLASVVTLDGGKTYLDVPTGSGAKGVNINYVSSNFSSTGALGKLTNEGSGIIIDNIPELNQNQQIELQNIHQSSSQIFIINLLLQKSFTHAQYLKLINKNGNTYNFNNNWIHSTGGTLLLTGGTLFGGNTLESIVLASPEIKLSFCSIKNSKERCSKELPLIVKDNVSYDIENKGMSTCEQDIDEIYQRLFKTSVSRLQCKFLVEINGWSNKSKEQKEGIILHLMNGENCIAYQKINGVLTGSGYLNCKAVKTKIGTSKIENSLAGLGYDLISFAGYDNDDISMIDKDQTVMSASASGITGAGEGLYRKYNTASGTFYSSMLGQTSLSLANLDGLGFTVSREANYDIYTWGENGKGIILDNYSTETDSLKYNISSLGITSTGSFAVELKVRGNALKRNSGFFYLFGLSDGGGTFNGSSLGFGLKNGDIGINAGTGVAFTSLSGALNFSDIKSTLEGNQFYPVVVVFHPHINTVSLYINNRKISDTELINGFGTLNFSGINSINIGGVNSNVIHWNDIIDSVKIYKKSPVALSVLKTILGDTMLSKENASLVFDKSNITN